MFRQTSAKQTIVQTQASTTYANQKGTILILFSVANTFIVFAFKTPYVLPYMVMWREI